MTRLVLNRPAFRNALDGETVEQLSRELREAAADPAVRVVELAGAGPCFSAGADLRSMRGMARAERAENLADARRFVAMLHALHTLPKPTVARVQGASVGGGVGLVACCDLAIASEDAVFRLSETRLGLVPAMVGPYLVQTLGPRAAQRLMLTGEPIGAAEALRCGLVHAVVPADALDEAVRSMTGNLLRGAPGALACCKELVREFASSPLDDALRDRTAQVLADRRSSDEGLAGVAAFLDKAQPPWVSKGSAKDAKCA